MDLEALYQFQKKCVARLDACQEIARQISVDRAAAAGMLQDQASKKTLDQVESIAERLKRLANHERVEIEKYMMATKKKIGDFNKLQGGGNGR